MKRIMIICGSMDYPNGICVDSILRETEHYGLMVDCVCSGKIKPQDSTVIHYHFVKDKLYYELQYNKDKLTSSLYNMGLWRSRLQAMIRRPFWPFDSPRYHKDLLETAENLLQKNKYDMVVGVYSPVECLMTASELKSKYLEIKFVAYFLDSLSGGLVPRFFTKEITFELGLKAERKLLQSADGVFIMKSHQQHYQEAWKNETWKEKVHVLEIPLFYIDSTKPPMIRKEKSKNEIEILYVGSLYTRLKSPKFFLSVLQHGNFSDIEVVFLGPSNCQSMISNAQFSLNVKIKQLDPVPHDIAVKKQNETDILLNIGSMNSNQIPCKIFEYMTTGKPIISTAPSKDEPSIRYLKSYPAALILYEDDSLQLNADKLAQFLHSAGSINVEPRQLEHSLYPCTPQAFWDTAFGV